MRRIVLLYLVAILVSQPLKRDVYIVSHSIPQNEGSNSFDFLFVWEFNNFWVLKVCPLAWKKFRMYYLNLREKFEPVPGFYLLFCNTRGRPYGESRTQLET